MSKSLIGTSLLNNTFIQDPKANWIKINNVALGQSDKFCHQVIQHFDVGNLLDTVDKETVVVVYNWHNGIAFTKTGFDINDHNDSALNVGYTSFVKVLPSPNPISIPKLIPIIPKNDLVE